MKRPTYNGEPHAAVCTTPLSASMIQLLGGITQGGVALSRDEFTRIKKLYGFKPEGPNKKPEPPPQPKREDFPNDYKYESAVKDWELRVKALDKWTDPQPMMQAGADRNALRHAEVDALRLLAWIARFVEPGGDPLRTLIRFAADAGTDIDPADIEWADEEVDEDVEG